MRPQYEQLGRYYDLAYGSDAEGLELNLYRRLAGQNGGRVLEMGSGTGRVCVPLVADGFDVTGVEFSPAMIEDPTFIQADSSYYQKASQVWICRK
jgi:SAM-dependent methyltransferase